eukprot:704874-Pelagomonas_calceolata.AAC.3
MDRGHVNTGCKCMYMQAVRNTIAIVVHAGIKLGRCTPPFGHHCTCSTCGCCAHMADTESNESPCPCLAQGCLTKLPCHKAETESNESPCLSLAAATAFASACLTQLQTLGCFQGAVCQPIVRIV